jgi:hypothetical protein
MNVSLRFFAHPLRTWRLKKAGLVPTDSVGEARSKKQEALSIKQIAW